MPNTSAAAAEPSPLAAKLMQKPPLSLDRLPVLRTTLANAAKGCQEATRPYASAPAEISLAKLESAESTAVVETARDNLCSIFRANAWDSRVLVTIDRAWLDAVVEAAYGGDGSEAPPQGEPRVTATELALAGAYMNRVGEVLRGAFAPVAATDFILEKFEPLVPREALGKRAEPVFAARFELSLLGRTGAMMVVIPHAALYAMRSRFADERTAIAPPADPAWTRKMRDGVVRAEVSIQASLEAPALTLGQISELKVGQIVELRAGIDSLVTLESGHERLFQCKLGQQRGHLTLMVASAISRKKETLSEVLLASLSG